MSDAYRSIIEGARQLQAEINAITSRSQSREEKIIALYEKAMRLAIRDYRQTLAVSGNRKSYRDTASMMSSRLQDVLEAVKQFTSQGICEEPYYTLLTTDKLKEQK